MTADAINHRTRFPGTAKIKRDRDGWAAVTPLPSVFAPFDATMASAADTVTLNTAALPNCHWKLGLERKRTTPSQLSILTNVTQTADEAEAAVRSAAKAGASDGLAVVVAVGDGGQAEVRPRRRRPTRPARRPPRAQRGPRRPPYTAWPSRESVGRGREGGGGYARAAALGRRAPLARAVRLAELLLGKSAASGPLAATAPCPTPCPPPAVRHP